MNHGSEIVGVCGEYGCWRTPRSSGSFLGVVPYNTYARVIGGAWGCALFRRRSREMVGWLRCEEGLKRRRRGVNRVDVDLAGFGPDRVKDVVEKRRINGRFVAAA